MFSFYYTFLKSCKNIVFEMFSLYYILFKRIKKGIFENRLILVKYFIELSFARGFWIIIFQILGYLFNQEVCYFPNNHIIGFLYNSGYLTDLPWMSLKMTIINVILSLTINIGFSYILTLIAFPTGIPEDL